MAVVICLIQKNINDNFYLLSIGLATGTKVRVRAKCRMSHVFHSQTMYQKNADAVKTWGYSFVIAVLMVGCLVAYIFMIRCYYSGSSAEGFSADQVGAS